MSLPTDAEVVELLRERPCSLRELTQLFYLEGDESRSEVRRWCEGIVERLADEGVAKSVDTGGLKPVWMVIGGAEPEFRKSSDLTNLPPEVIDLLDAVDALELDWDNLIHATKYGDDEVAVDVDGDVLAWLLEAQEALR